MSYDEAYSKDNHYSEKRSPNSSVKKEIMKPSFKIFSSAYSSIHPLIRESFSDRKIKIEKKQERKISPQKSICLEQIIFFNQVKIPYLPEFYPLSKTHTTVNKNTRKNGVISGIVKLLQIYSITCIFNEKTAQASCETIEHVRFSIFLFQPEKNNMDSILVEIERISGCPIIFHHYSRLLLNDLMDTTTENKKKQSPLDYYYYCTKNKITQNSEKIIVSQKECQDVLENITSLLSNNESIDSLLLGMESLQMHVNENIALKPNVAQNFASCVLTKNNRDNFALVHDFVKKWFFYQNKHQNLSKNCEEEIRDLTEEDFSCVLPFEEERTRALLHNYSLSIVAHSLEIFTKVDFDLSFSSWMIQNGQDILQVLLFDLERSIDYQEYLHDAYYAVKVLKNLVFLLNIQVHEKLVELIHQNHAIGLKFHHLLAQECKDLLDILL